MALDPPYEDLAKKQGSQLAALLQQRHLQPDSDDLSDFWVLAFVVRIGFWMLTFLVRARVEQAVRAARPDGLRPWRHHDVCVTSLLGNLTLPSPYLYSRKTRESSRPLRDLFGWYDHCRTDAVERALSDFGAHDSFALSKQRFERHYFATIGDSAPRDTTLAVAQRAAEFVDAKLDQMAQDYDLPPAQRRVCAKQMLVESDGCLLRTGVVTPASQAIETAERLGASETELERLKRAVGSGVERCRIQIWREVHSGLARRKEQAEPSVLGRRCSRNEAVGQLFKLACSHGLEFDTQVLALGDGGNGLKEAFEEHFARVHFLLDWRHMEVEHLEETARALGMCEAMSKRWARVRIERMARGEALEVLAELTSKHLELEAAGGEEAKPGHERLDKLLKYIEKHIKNVDYDRWREQGWPIGSSEVESLHKRLIQKRMKLNGACWREENLDPMLALRTVALNPGWWEEFWDWEFERRQHERKTRAAA